MRRRNIMPIQLIALILLFALVVIGLVLSYSIYDKTNRHDMQIRKLANDMNAVYNVVGNLEQFIQHLPPAMGGFTPSAPVQGVVPQADVYQDELLPEDVGYDADDGVDEYIFDADACCPDGECPGGVCRLDSECPGGVCCLDGECPQDGECPGGECPDDCCPCDDAGSEIDKLVDELVAAEVVETETDYDVEPTAAGDAPVEPTAEPEEVLPEDFIKRVVIESEDKGEKKKRTPNESPSGFDLGYQMQSENDGHQYQVVENKNGKKRWKKID